MALDARDGLQAASAGCDTQGRSSKVCLYALYQHSTLDLHVKALVRSAAYGYDIVAVNNGTLPAEAKDEMMACSSLCRAAELRARFRRLQDRHHGARPTRLADLTDLLLNDLDLLLFDDTTLLEEMEKRRPARSSA